MPLERTRILSASSMPAELGRFGERHRPSTRAFLPSRSSRRDGAGGLAAARTPASRSRVEDVRLVREHVVRHAETAHGDEVAAQLASATRPRPRAMAPPPARSEETASASEAGEAGLDGVQHLGAVSGERLVGLVASSIISIVSPSDFVSICIAVIPSLVPPTLKIHATKTIFHYLVDL